MYSSLIAFALFVSPVFAAFAINNPTLTQCKTAKISWPETKGPYNVIAVAAKDPCGEPLVDIGDFTKTFVEWKVTLPAGTKVQLSVADSDDQEAWTGNITVGASSDSSCLSTPLVSASTTIAASDVKPSSTSTGTTSGDDTTTGGNTGVDIVGAANAGSNKFLSAAPSVRQLSTPVMALSAFAAVVALAL